MCKSQFGESLGDLWGKTQGLEPLEFLEILEFLGNTPRARPGLLRKLGIAWIIQEVGNFMFVPRIIQTVQISAWGDALGKNSGSGIPGISGKTLPGTGWKNGNGTGLFRKLGILSGFQ